VIADSGARHPLRPQPFQPKLHITNADFLSITHNGQLCDAEGGLGLREFELVMRDQVLCVPARVGACSERGGVGELYSITSYWIRSLTPLRVHTLWPGPKSFAARLCLKARWQVRLYTMQYLASDTTLMTPIEEVFSRRGGVKLLLMEVEQLRCALDKLQQPAAHPRAGPGVTSTEDTGVQTSTKDSRSKVVWARGDKWARSSPSPAVEAMPELGLVSMETSAPACGNELNPGVFHSERAPVLTRYITPVAMAVVAQAGGGLKEAGHSNPYLQSISSATQVTVSGSSRRAVRAGFTRGSRLDLRREVEAGAWTQGPEAAPAQLSEREICLLRSMAKTSTDQRGNSRNILDQQTFVSNARMDSVSQSRTSGTVTSASESGGRGRPFSTVIVTAMQRSPLADSRDNPGGPPLRQPGAQKRVLKLGEVLAALPPL
jgi:hypothetical protein